MTLEISRCRLICRSVGFLGNSLILPSLKLLSLYQGLARGGAHKSHLFRRALDGKSVVYFLVAHKKNERCGLSLSLVHKCDLYLRNSQGNTDTRAVDQDSPIT